MQKTTKYSLKDISDCYDHDGHKLISITLRTTDGQDEMYAAKQADARGSEYVAELTRLTVVCYETTAGEQDVKQPFLALDKWGSKIRSLILAAFRKQSMPNDTELADFFATASDPEHPKP